MAILYFSDILNKVGLDPKRVKLIRHALSDKNFMECYRAGKVFEYTCHQKAGFSNGYDYWAVFISGVGTLAELYAVYKVGDSVPDTADLVPEGLPETEASQYNSKYVVYQLTPVDFLKEYERRLIIDWGKGTRKWDQKGTTEKPIVSIRQNRNKPFPGFEALILTFDELNELYLEEEIYGDWRTAMSSVNAIYLIVDCKTGKQYVGSTYGSDGLWGRWKCYVDTHHGNSVKMKDLICDFPQRYHSFQFSILQILPKNISPDEAVQVETLYKKKLLSMKFGMNKN